MVNGVDRDEEIIIYILNHCLFCIGVTLQRFKLRSYNFLWLLTACATVSTNMDDVTNLKFSMSRREEICIQARNILKCKLIIIYELGRFGIL